MTNTLGLIYTTPTIVDAVTKTVSEIMPSIYKFNMIDDRIARVVLEEGLTPKVHRIVASYVQTAEDEGADAVLVTCSSISPCVDTARPLVSIPVMKIDDPMTNLATDKASKIGVVATSKSTLEPTTKLLLKKAEMKNKKVELTTELCSGAFDALSNGDLSVHDKLVLEGIRRATKSTDLVVLAQVSMARIMPQIKDIQIPILTSLRSGVEQVKPVFALDK